MADEADPGICVESRADHYAMLAKAAGADAVRHAEQAIVVRVLDDRWADHLALIEDVREGIHLQRYGGREPVMEFHRQIVEGFGTSDGGRAADRRRSGSSACGWSTGRSISSAVGLAGSSSTWTYLVNDNPFSTLGLSMLASRNVGAAGAMGMLAVMYWPVTMVVAASVFVRRWLARRR